MQRKALRATVGGVDVDVPTGTWTGGQFLRYNAGTGLIDSAAGGGGAGDFVGPAASVDNHLVLFNGITGKLGKDSAPIVVDAAGNMTGVGTITSGLVNGVAVAAHAARHLPAGADTMFPGAWAANDDPQWSGAAFVPRREFYMSHAADQTAIGTALTALTGFPVALSVGTHVFEFVGWYWSSAATVGFAIGAAFTGTSTSQVIGGHIERTTFPGLAVETTALATKVSTATLAPITQGTRLPFSIRGRIVVTVAGNFSLQVSTTAAAGTVNVEKGSTGWVRQVA